MKLSRSVTLEIPARPAGRWAFSLIELLVTIAIMGIIAGLLVGLAPAAMKRARESRLRAELRALEAAIENYKAKYGVFPPDGLVLSGTVPQRDSNGNLVVRPELNPLFYELTGVVVNDALSPNGYFVPLGDDDGGNPPRLTSADLRPYFGRDGFVNATTPERKRSLFRMEFKESASAEIFALPGNPDLHVLAVGWAGDASRPGQHSGIPWPKNNPKFPPPIPTNPQLNPWRYVSSNPTNNPGKFDLWAEYIENNEKKIVGNWRH